MICDTPPFVFIAIPKTGTRTIYNFLENTYKVKLIEDHLINVPALFSDRYTFTVVRNPYDRICSAWWSTCMRGKDRYGYIKKFNEYGLPNSLLSFLIVIQNKFEGVNYLPTINQSRYLKDNRIDHIIRFENFNEGLNSLKFVNEDVVLNNLNATTLITENNSTKRPDWSELVCSRSIMMINEIYNEDFYLLNYDMLLR